MIQHYVKGASDDNFAVLASMYGVTGDSISQATFGGTGASLIYPWLRDNGGQPQSSAPAVPTGRHWSFSRGMVVNIPASESKSPVSYYSDPPATPGGPEVTVFYSDSPVVGDAGAPSTGRESWNDAGDAVADVEPALVDPATGREIDVGHAGVAAGEGFMGISWTAWLIVGMVVYAMMGGDKKKKRKTTGKKRRTTRRKPAKRKRRRNYHRQFYGGDDD